MVLLLAGFSLSASVLISGAARAQSEEDPAPKVIFDPKGLKDPFRSPEEKEKPPEEIPEAEAVEARPLPELRVQGLIWGGKIPQAIVNGTVVTVGDVISEARIEAIGRSGITVFFDKRSYDIFSPAQKTLDSLEKRTQGGDKK